MTDNDSTRYVCRLDLGGARARRPQLRRLVARLRDRERFPGGLRLTFERDAETDRLVDTFIRDETACCPFGAYTAETHTGATVLELRYPADAGTLPDSVLAMFDPHRSEEERWQEALRSGLFR